MAEIQNTISDIIMTLMKSTHQKHDNMLDVNGFLYVFNKIDGKIVYYWRCHDCAAKFQTTMISNTHVPDDKGKPFNISNHCHGPIPQIIECKKIKNVIKRKAAETYDTPSSIYQDTIAQVENIIASQISKCSAKSIVKRQRKTNIKEPDHISDVYDLSVDTLSGKKFLNKTFKRN